MKCIKFLILFWGYAFWALSASPWVNGKTFQQPFPQYLKSSQSQAVTLLAVNLSPTHIKKMITLLEQPQNIPKKLGLAMAVNLGMNDVPVFNQGVHGSCVVFAVTAALDAALNSGDYISQLCSLQLGKYLQAHGFSNSCWNGGIGSDFLYELEHFGFMNKSDQRQYTCGGLSEYPMVENDTAQAMSLEDFHQHAQSLEQNHVSWTSILDAKHFNESEYQVSNLINQIKEALNQGDRVVFGVILMDYEKGLIGAVGKHKVFNDTWLITPEIIQDIKINPQFAGHEMVIIGYDDQAIARDDHERLHQGLFKLRNSWGDRIGDQGDFYMSYDYFKTMMVEAQRIKLIPNHY
jgi:hypothetical protein